MHITQRLLFYYSKFYDLITIGPYANKIAKTVSHSCVGMDRSVKILTVE